MGLDASRTSQNDNTSRRVGEPRDRPKDMLRDEPKAEQVDRFRNLLQAKTKGDGAEKLELRRGSGNGHTAKSEMHGASAADRGNAQTETAVSRRDGYQDDQSGGNQKHEAEVLKPAELAALHQAQLAPREVQITSHGAPQAAQANPQKLADMLERHVRQLAVTAGSNGARDQNSEVLLRLADSTLPGTDLLLTKTETGWLLRVDARSRSSYEAIRRATSLLQERFASRDLGALEIVSHLRE